MCYTISAAKANRLYWLGRYTERVYLGLHLLRKYYDKLIDGDAGRYEEEYYEKVGAANVYGDKDAFRLGYMYDAANPGSLLSGLTAANDNAIVLREEIMSETLSYVQLSLCRIQEAAAQKDPNISNLQPITDYLLAFWGSIDERVFDERVRNFLKMGKLVENIDMHVRFDYPFGRIAEAYDSLRECALAEDGVLNREAMADLDEMLMRSLYDRRDSAYRTDLLTNLNNLILV